ncbi:threonine/homoserine/homoserine lactone efflux protein [Sinobacterium caligoides]|uniref:Threonine/homoserine/homoserine lactone efflux protein n=1 Tax=Sinobacterium caligoides TaxID=933926 RepID=A0A3N2DN62_9GAMM|nr:LysE family transporter [Sinobacterium caligoides]ROS01089.1 threonine/homoserine/homoserine lactone efflux protein [Sinobacterium caligoides]
MSILSFFLFSFMASITPGPANIALLTASGSKNFSGAATFLAGICSGFALVLLVSILPFSGVSLLPEGIKSGFISVIQILGAVYLIYISFVMLRQHVDERDTSLGFFHGLLIHPLSPKAWFFVVSAYSTFIDFDNTGVLGVALYVFIFLCSAIVAHWVWLLSGYVMKGALNEGQLVLINKVLCSGLLALSLYMLVYALGNLL